MAYNESLAVNSFIYILKPNYPLVENTLEFNKYYNITGINHLLKIIKRKFNLFIRSVNSFDMRFI